jgi:hypothetical protein
MFTVFKSFFLSLMVVENKLECLSAGFSRILLNLRLCQASQRRHNTQHNNTQYNAIHCLYRLLLCWMSFMLSVAIKSVMLNVVILNAIMPSVFMLNVVPPS